MLSRDLSRGLRLVQNSAIIKLSVSLIFLLSLVLLLIAKERYLASLNVSLRSNPIRLRKNCISSSGDISVFTFKGQWEKDIKSVCNELDKYRFKKDFKRRIYKSIVGEFPIYISDPKVDGISRRIDYNGTFEPRIFQTIYDFVNHDSDINVIDIGANVGAISLQVAKWGRHVLSIEASDMNVRRYCAGAKDANIGKYTTLIHNAISDNHEPVRFILGRRGESGGNFIDESDIRKAKKRIDGNIYDYKHSVELKTVMLDDVLSLPNACLFQKVFIKVDVEGAEHKVFQGARKFFEKNDVIGVLMEWSWHRLRNGTKDIIINFMKEFKFDSFAYNERNLTAVDAQYTDEHDLLWLPRKRKDRRIFGKTIT